MSHTNAKDILNERFALNLKKWVNQRKIKSELAGLDLFNKDKAVNVILQVVKENPRWFYHEKSDNKSNWEIAYEYFKRLGSYVHKR
jgi:isopropylmalate/homocitrate/citramalate synthase